MEHPYEEYENTGPWKILDKALEQLERNSDIQLTTDRRYVIGYLCRQLRVAREADLASPDGTPGQS